MPRDRPRPDQPFTAGSFPAGEAHRSGQGEAHNHSGVVAFGASASYRVAGQTTADLARVLSDQIGMPVDDATGLTGKYDITLNIAKYVGDMMAQGKSMESTPVDPQALISMILQDEFGLKLVSGEPALARLFVVDRVAPRPTEN